MKSILDPAFHYTNSQNTDLSKTFARIRGDQRKQKVMRRPEQALAEALPPGAEGDARRAEAAAGVAIAEAGLARATALGSPVAQSRLANAMSLCAAEQGDQAASLRHDLGS